MAGFKGPLVKRQDLIADGGDDPRCGTPASALRRSPDVESHRALPAKRTSGLEQVNVCNGWKSDVKGRSEGSGSPSTIDPNGLIASGHIA